MLLVFGTASLRAQTIGGIVVGGGNNGTTGSTTSVTIDKGCIVNDVFGAGNGATATASGNSSVTVKAGTIKGNIYGGGNKAAMTGDTQVTLQGGTYEASVFAGARQANITGNTNLLLDGVHVAADAILTVPYVYGGNDVSGQISGTATVQAVGKSDHSLNIKVTDLFAGGNGDYDYTTSKIVNEVETNPYYDLTKPDLTTAVLDIQAGQYDRVFGGGNAATITSTTTIGINNSTILTDNTAYQFGQVFGGNNKAVMSIRPTWNLQKGYIDNLYSGGNAGNMTNVAGILLSLNAADLYVNNTYGGCRMADVDPDANKGSGSVASETVTEDVSGTSTAIATLPADYAAKVLVRAGHYNNIYGGNDISGQVYYGTDVEIDGATISGDVYGSGNGSYAYTNTDQNKDNDLYYTTDAKHSTLIEALFWHRPSVAKARLHFWGTEAKPAFVAGNTYCGGNSATIINSDGTAGQADVVFGEHVTLNQFFFGCNGENMKDATILAKYADSNYSTLALTNSDVFARYMDGCASTYLPNISYDWTNGTTSTPEQSDVKIGSFYVGGNVGSIKTSSNLNLTFLHGLTIYDKIVGGCNNANVDAGTYNVAYAGGVLNTATDGTSRTHTFTVDSRLEPRTMGTLDKDTRGFLTTESPTWDWHTATYKVEGATAGATADLTTLQGGNVYGGCYQSGAVEGNVVINISKDLISPNITSASVDLDKTADYVFSKTFNVFGGGYGEKAVIKGNTAVNLSANARVLKVYGGGEMGAVGYNDNGTLVGGNTTVSTLSTLRPDANGNNNVWRIYGGSFEGPILGTAQLTLLGGKINSAVAGNCNADLDGYPSVQIGSDDMVGTGYPHITNAVYGGNDFGGLISGTQDKSVDGWTVRSNSYVQYLAGKVDGKIFGGARGSYDYDTESLSQHSATTKSGFAKPQMQTVINAADASNTKSVGANCFVDIASTSTSANDHVGSGDGTGFFGGGEGKLNKSALVDVNSSFVLLHAATTQQRYATGAGVLTPNVYGGGYYSVVANTRLEAETGYVNTLYGGTNGATAASMDASVNYNSTSIKVNLYSTMDNTTLTVFGGGSYAGSTNTDVELWGGKVQNVYGGSNKEGYCGTTLVNVPAGSTVAVTNIFGGGRGSNTGLPCDVGTSNVNFSSDVAYVSGGVYGGNDNCRATQITNINLYASVRKTEGGEFTPVYGAGYGMNTVAGYTHVNLDPDVANSKYVEANKIYGGGNNGKVLGAYDDNTGASAYYGDGSTNAYAHWSYPALTADATSKWGYTYPDGYSYNTNITIPTGATVQNVYAAGYGSAATVSGSTHVDLTGGTITEDIFGGGEEGNVEQQTSSTLGTGTAPENQAGNIFTYLNIQGGKVRNVYGGGYNGNVGTSATNTAIEQTRVEIGADALLASDPLSFQSGEPTVLRSVYGGGYKGAVYATARVKMYGGYVGYTYDATDGYTKLLDLNTSGDKLLKQSGNIYGGGYGEGASTDHSEVTIYGGTVRNSVYGGGEIASVGRADYTTNDPQHLATKSNRNLIPYMTLGGSTKVYMYGGLVEGNVFGGGRGYAIDPYGNTQTGDVGYSDGFTFGTTEVNIYRGTIGTETSVADGDGNVFGGGNIGYCYSFDGNPSSSYGQEHTSTTGYYYKNGVTPLTMTEDCKVVVSPYARILKEGATLTYNGKTYNRYDYVPTDALNSVTDWTIFGDNMDEQGVTIGNAIFAGGNVSSGSDKVYANAKTVFGNATASLVDCKNKDLVSVGKDNVGGLYGDGNLTFVDGYRELNITNYGTDYYSLNSTINKTEYDKLSNRERSYFKVKYKCLTAFTTSGGTTYAVDQIIDDTEYRGLSNTDQLNFEVSEGTCNIYSGRILNTIQRADFCGIFGSRLVLQGAQDRVVTTADYTNYSINRVKEVSLNQKDGKGNYIGFYNVVHYLGALTSDVQMTAVRTTTNTDCQKSTVEEGGIAYGTATYWDWKKANKGKKTRNDGTSVNEVALCSGVFLEIVDESSEVDENEKKIYGPITGVVQLDLINAVSGEGGGYVYAKNEHGIGTRNASNNQITLAAENSGAASYKEWSYNESGRQNIRRKDASVTPSITDLPQETSGNFVNADKIIIDDCYPNHDNLSADNNGHYWYIKGEYYFYDQYISAYSGTRYRYSANTNIPLTIDNDIQGKLKLEYVEQNRYAYWTGTLPQNLQGDNANTIFVNNNSYSKGDPISYYEYSRLTDEQKSYFTDNIYFCSEKVGSYEAGKVLTPTEYDAIFTGDGAIATKSSYVCTVAYSSNTGVSYTQGQIVTEDTYKSEVQHSVNYRQNFLPINECVNTANAVACANGYDMTFDWNNPDDWDAYYIRKDNSTTDKIITKAQYAALSDKTSYSPYTGTYNYSGSTKVLGRETYSVGDIISETAKAEGDEVKTYYTSHSMSTDINALATFDEMAYVAKEDVTIGDQTYKEGTCISTTDYTAMSAANKSKFSQAHICTTSYQSDNGTYYLIGDIISDEVYNALPGTDDKTENFKGVYICTANGYWGGTVFEAGHNYSAYELGNVALADRLDAGGNSLFTFNKDALNALWKIGTGSTIAQCDINTASPIYSAEQVPDYDATYTGSSTLYLGTTSVTPQNSSTATSTLTNGTPLLSTEYAKLVNEKTKYVKIAVSGTSTSSDNKDLGYYIVTTPFTVGETTYKLGDAVTDAEYTDKGLSSNSDKFTHYSLDGAPNSLGAVIYYWCKEDYTRPSVTTGNATVTAISGENSSGTAVSYSGNGQVKKGDVFKFSDTEFAALINQKEEFSITASVPSVTTAFYVPKASQIAELRKDRIITYDYTYTYEEPNDDGSYSPTTEHHIINVTVHFESGQPTIGVLLPPGIVMPGTKIGLNQPGVSKGAFEVLGGGWEMYATEDDAANHTNPLTYVNNETPLHWYNNGYYVAYYAKSFLGKTYSNAVQLSVANYHRMKDVLSSTHDVTTTNEDGSTNTTTVHDYMYINDAANTTGLRNSKIYINSQEELDDLKTLFNLTQGSDLTGVKDCKRLDFIIQEDIDHTGSSWTSIGDASHCFEGNVHGDGHTISGLDHSLFAKLCGNVYNIGVTGSFTGAGIADAGDGKVTNAWISSTAQPVTGTYPVIGDGNGLAINCYYPETMNYKDASGINGWSVSPKSAVAFQDGEVAYNLNSFYLNKRYALGNGGSYLSGMEQYVEDFRYGNEDYIYSLGSIPLLSESRWDPNYGTSGAYVPVYPDDYLFFGQKLTYGLMQGAAHQSEPGPVAKKDVYNASEYTLRRLDTDASKENRVLRAPGYYRSKDKQAVYFNSDANFAGTYIGQEVYEKLTAIDFTGYNDASWTTSSSQSKFYLPMLDFTLAENIINAGASGYTPKSNIRSINFNGLTKNLLVYGDPTDDAATYTIFDAALPEPAITTSTDAKYDAIDAVNAATQATIYGHLVDKTTDGYLATRNHYLVDKQPFNCPIEYSFNDNTGNKTWMWYQRTPEVYSDGTKGWESICLPFSAYQVTTQDKGEITHFYGQSQRDHEYWLRGFCDMKEVKNSENVAVPTAMFYRPQELNDPGYDYRYEFATTAYTVDNTFLWDYYYQYALDARQDVNADVYQQGYYNTARSYTSYPYYTAQIPYIISFPGETFYEFDLSGEYEAQYTGASIMKLLQQVITFCSKDGQTIAVSDDENRKSTFKCQGSTYTYQGTYLPVSLSTANYQLDATGAQFNQCQNTDNAVPFRAYYTLTSTANAAPRYIALGVDAPYKNQNSTGEPLRGITVTAKNHNIIVESGLDHDVPVSIVNAAGARIASFTLTPGDTVTTHVTNAGVYMVAANSGTSGKSGLSSKSGFAGHKIMVK